MRVAAELLSNYQHLIADLTLITGDKGIFDVEVDGQTIYAKHQTGRQAHEGEVLTAFEALLPPDAKRYGT